MPHCRPRRLLRGELRQHVLACRRNLRSVGGKALHDPAAARFIVVTRAGAVPRAETERLIGRLRRLRLAVPAVLINAMTLSPQKCSWCRAIAAAERRERSRLTRACGRGRGECAIILTPLAAPPPRGSIALERWSNTWTSDGPESGG